ncbi:PREDICTED: omega-3 fatty acid desaturase, chloroplastic-like isoform X1 [Fragaria vesca subsp. vesca]|uniref:omega-3 fatty acid desaturase, chloroplastic-like isoform X1 n=1 Tax=Fragaria vesca subsp. vesca TaxID=101020 RepID=UPI0002C33705|nr:PREDICTED: omega-3 fatty acid desaturase, chloroplastic-like isoform X1 [Fragaria vesca subsp. vesca]
MFKISSMANGMVMPPCSLSPLPRMYPRTRNDPTSTPFRQLQLSQSRSLGFCFRLSDGFKEKCWAARVGAPLSDATFHDEGDEVDTSGAIPKHCWVKNPWKSMSYVVRDVAVVAGLVSLAVKFDCWAVWLFYWCAQSIMFWDLFVLAHDSFHAWRTSHQKIQNHGNVENDNPLNEKTQILRFFFPIHPWSSSPRKMGSHYDPNSELFFPNERIACWITMVVLLVALSFVIGPILMLKLYGAPYVGFVVCLDLVNYLSPQIPHYKSTTNRSSEQHFHLNHLPKNKQNELTWFLSLPDSGS